ncbi:MAG: putative amino acid racemase [Paracoccaceae bacterium]|jgi:predicted amino acid racemase
MSETSAFGRPRVEYSATGLRQNCATLVDLCAQYQIEIAGVTKATAGNPEIADLMLSSGIPMLAESRLVNIRRLRNGGCTAPIMLLRPPTFAEMDDAAGLADIFLLSDPASITALAMACQGVGKPARVIIMVDLGDLREGVPPDELPGAIDAVLATPNVDIVGLGTNLACNLGLLPDAENMRAFVDMAHQIEAQIGKPLEYLSAGNSSAIALMLESKLPREINHLRLGESLLLGRETAYGAAIAATRPDNFCLVAQVLEVWDRQPPIGGEHGANALGQQVTLMHQGKRRFAVLNLGAVDTEIAGLQVLNTGVSLIGFSSDHLIADTTDAPGISAGDELRFLPNYHALATAMSSPYLMQSGAQAVGK